ncbi:MAG: ADP-forming succinate--CoA ligase subunit beta [Candidatus Brocadiales bacterium]
MKIYEYQAKDILRRCGINIPSGKCTDTAEGVADIFSKLRPSRCVLKAQILAGGRGKGGGIKIVNTTDEAKDCAAKMLGSPLLTHQTGTEGIEVKKILVEEALPIERELYLAFAIDRSSEIPVAIGSKEGGVDIEEIAKNSPNSIFKEPFDASFGLHRFQARRISSTLGVGTTLLNNAAELVTNLAKIFIEKDCSLLEINPLVLTKDNKIVALDVKMIIDDNALYRHPEIASMRDFDSTELLEAEAARHNLSYIGLDGNIGCLVNGAGLAMATMDIIKLHGGQPANFLDVGGDAPIERVKYAFELLLSDTKVKAVLVNIFGGIMKCDVIAEGIIRAAKEIGIKVPLVVRLEGTNVDKGKKLLKDSGLNIISADGMTDGAVKVLKAIR